MLKYPGFNPIAIEIGPVKVHWYGVMYLLGFAGGWWLARLRAGKPGSTWKASDVDDLIFYEMLGVILGGLLGVIGAMAVYAWRHGRNAADVFDFTAPLPAVGLFFGRIGNFINGEL